jgi:glycosyltransferase involved in cell wall biosynthesis
VAATFPDDRAAQRYRFHILGIPHTISIREYNACPFTQKTVKLCALLKRRGHYVVHYGHEDSQVACDEHVTVINRDDLSHAYGNHDWRREGPPEYRLDDHAYRAFIANAIGAVGERKERGDFLLCMAGPGHLAIADAHRDMLICEPGIGYGSGHFAPLKVFQSYAILHAYLGLNAVESVSNNLWYDAVIPNFFNVDDFEYSADKDDYFLFLGRVGDAKGVNIAIQIIERIGGRLIVAGPGTLDGLGTLTDRPVREYVEHVGVADIDARKKLMSRAKAMLLPSLFVEPFCGVQIEAMLSGTPVITTDWGAFAEYNLHGVTGYRCRTFEHFTWAARNIGNINPAACREWAVTNFSTERAGEMYDEYFYAASNVYWRGGWYHDNPGRTELNWLAKRYPAVAPATTTIDPRSSV